MVRNRLNSYNLSQKGEDIMKKYLLKDALENGYAVGAFNFGTLEVLKSILNNFSLIINII